VAVREKKNERGKEHPLLAVGFTVISSEHFFKRSGQLFNRRGLRQATIDETGGGADGSIQIFNHGPAATGASTTGGHR
jgi:hypothetical protein